MTITTTNIPNAIKRLDPSENDILVFDTGRIWDSLSFWESLPRFKSVEVSQEVRQQISKQVNLALKYNDLKEENVGQQLDWSTIPEFMTLINEISPIVSYYALPSYNMIIYESVARSGGEPGLSCIYLKDGKFKFTYAPHIIFDMDDGFINSFGEGPCPKELTDAFNTWVVNNRVGPVLG